MGIISLIIKAFFLYILFTLIIGAWRFFRTFKMIKNQHGQAHQQFEDLFRERQKTQYSEAQKGPKPSGETFEAEYRVVHED